MSRIRRQRLRTPIPFVNIVKPDFDDDEDNDNVNNNDSNEGAVLRGGER